MKTLALCSILIVGFALAHSASAAEVTGKIVSVINDDGGEKIIVAVDGAKKSTTYLQNSHPSFEPMSELLTLARESNKRVVITVDDNYLRFVKSISIAK